MKKFVKSFAIVMVVTFMCNMGTQVVKANETNEAYKAAIQYCSTIDPDYER